MAKPKLLNLSKLMVNGWFTWNLKNRIYVALLFSLLVGCSESSSYSSPTHSFDFDKLKSGDLICRLGNGYFSNFFRKYASREQKYSHIGILSRENDSIFVYHAEASEFSGVGRVKREPIQSFLESIEVYDIFELNLPNYSLDRIVKSVQDYYLDKIPFDLDFDSTNDDRLYCTELIATAINQNVVDSMRITPSLSLNGKQLYALDDIYLNRQVSIIPIEK